MSDIEKKGAEIVDPRLTEMADTAIGMGLIEELGEVTEELRDLARITSKQTHRDTMNSICERLEFIVNVLDTQADPIVIRRNTQLSERFTSVVVNLGISGELIRMRQQGVALNVICRTLNISTEAARRFFRYYDSITPTEQIKYNKNSVMNTTERLEELMNMILRRLHALEGMNDEVHVQYIKELRQTIDLASKVAERIVSYEQYNNFKSAVWEILKTMAPERRTEIIKQIQKLNREQNFLNSP